MRESATMPSSPMIFKKTTMSLSANTASAQISNKNDNRVLDFIHTFGSSAIM